MKVHRQVDASGLVCPEPVIRARIGLSGLAVGETLELIATDPHAELDIEVFCATAGHKIELVQQQDQQWRFLITRGQSPAAD